MQMKMIWFVAGVSIVANGVLGYAVWNASNAQEALQERFPYLSKRIFANNQNDVIINFIPLRQAMNEYIETQGGKVGAYFEYLPSGTSIGANDKKEVRLASLSKVPLAMSIFKKVELGKMSLDDTLVIKKEHLDDKFGTLWKKGEGSRLTILEFVEHALQESDNTAYNVLFDALTSKEVNEVYDGLDIPVIQEGNQILASPKNYSSIFRSLYLSSFLTEESSNRILDILSHTAFRDKIPAGIPEEVKIAHKIGVFQEQDLHENTFIDCGIVYVPNRPYILCLFVQDTEEKVLEHMSIISKMVYGYIIRVKGGR